jgi:hypothetical protein
MKNRMFLVVFSLFLSSCANTSTPSHKASLLGDAAPLTTATRTIVITPATKYVNVEGGDIVKFVAGDKTFAWTFPSDGDLYFDLNKVAPTGTLDHPVMVQSTPKERYMPY